MHGWMSITLRNPNGLNVIEAAQPDGKRAREPVHEGTEKMLVMGTVFPPPECLN